MNNFNIERNYTIREVHYFGLIVNCNTEEKSEYEKAKEHKERKAKAPKQWRGSQTNSGEKIIGSIT